MKSYHTILPVALLAMLPACAVEVSPPTPALGETYGYIEAKRLPSASGAPDWCGACQRGEVKLLSGENVAVAVALDDGQTEYIQVTFATPATSPLYAVTFGTEDPRHEPVASDLTAAGFRIQIWDQGDGVAFYSLVETRDVSRISFAVTGESY